MHVTSELQSLSPLIFGWQSNLTHSQAVSSACSALSHILVTHPPFAMPCVISSAMHVEREDLSIRQQDMKTICFCRVGSLLQVTACQLCSTASSYGACRDPWRFPEESSSPASPGCQRRHTGHGPSPALTDRLSPSQSTSAGDRAVGDIHDSQVYARNRRRRWLGGTVPRGSS